MARIPVAIWSGLLQDVGDDQPSQCRHPDEAPKILAQDDQRQDELETNAPKDRSEVHIPAVIGHYPGQAQEDHQTKNADGVHRGAEPE